MAHALTQTDPAGAIVLRLPDALHALVGVRLVQEIGLPGNELDFAYREAEGGWALPLPPVPVWRMEYRLALLHPDGGTEVICDPGNPLRAPGAFGEKSVIEFPGYRPPAWLDMPAAPGEWRDLTVTSRALRAEVPTHVWSPAPEAGPPRGILLAHDGGEFDRFDRLGHYCAAMIAAGILPPHHLVLTSPVVRNDWYAVNPAYARALANEVLPRVRATLETAAPVVALGASLGGLSLLHAQRRYPDAFAGLFLQSGSFFQNRYDFMEKAFPRFRHIVRFVIEVRQRQQAGVPVPTVITCGIAEENLSNNRDMAKALDEQGYPVRLVEVPDAHNFIAWRDAWHPELAELAARVWAPPRPSRYGGR
jgi:enterochelin esterase-like enzyme